MIAALFVVPFYGRSISPTPEPKPARFQKGQRVVWKHDREEGWVVAASDHSVSVEWDESGIYVYAITSLAARENIIVLESEEGSAV